MATCKPHYLLFCDGCLIPSGALHTEARGRWRFVLEDIVTGQKSEATDCEPSDHLDRISLLAVTRGLEALEQPSRVTLITTSRYVARGLQYGLVEWREHDYCWEHFGSIQPIRNADLWRRVDVALRFHEVQCRWMSQESPLREETNSAAIPPDRLPEPAAMEPVSCELAGQEDAAVGVVLEDTDAHASSFQSEERVAVSVSASARYSSPEELVLRTATRGSHVPIEESNTAAVVAKSVGVPVVVELRPSSPDRRLLRFGVTRPIRWLWNIILAADAFLISCLRCLFLLDPRRDHFRRRNY